MEFNGWTDLISFYDKYLRSDNMKEVWCVLDRKDYNRLIGFMEFLDNGETREKEFVATLNFEPFYGFPNLVMMGGLHFVPVKEFTKEEVKLLSHSEQ